MQEISVDEMYEFSTSENAMRKKDWAAGALGRQLVSKICFDREYKPVNIETGFSPCLDKCSDELIVNALDQVVLCSKVTRLEVTFDRAGCITVYNNGVGVSSDIHQKASRALAREVRAPEVIFGMMFQGSNTTKKAGSITGGTNGLGSKIANCHAVRFDVRTVRAGKLYEQTWEKNMEIKHPPKITNTTEEDSVMITFMPDYLDDFGYTKETLQTELSNLEAALRTRMVYAAIYAKCMSNCVVKFNKQVVPIRTMGALAKAMYGLPIVKTTLKVQSYDWQIVAVINTRAKQAQHVAITNGIITPNGTHLQHFATKLTANLQEQFVKKIDSADVRISPSIIGSAATLMMCTMVPDAKWGGQRKEDLTIDAVRFRNIKFTDEFIDQVYAAIKGPILCASVTKKKATGRQKEVVLDCYTPAAYCNDKRRAQRCGLLVGEGNSVANQLRMAVNSTIGQEEIGIMCLRGVPMNARKHIDRVTVTNGDTVEEVIIRKNELIKNRELNGMTAALGLDISYKYEVGSPSYADEIAEMHYGYLCMCVDQDFDGKGNILCQVVSMFELFWPNLLKAGYLRWLITPIIRMYPKEGGQVLSFYSIAAYKQFAESGKVDCSKYDVRYYKGLGTHEPEEIIDEIKKFPKNVVTITYDAATHESIEIYLGKISDKRKQALSKPFAPIPDEISLRITATNAITCSELMLYEADPYQRDNLARKLDHVLDGQNQCGRMVLNHLLSKLHKMKRIKIDGLAGDITHTQHYSHGEASLHQTLIGKAFLATGGKQLPFLIPSGNFGTRLEGGHDASPPRYLYTTPNKKLLTALFPTVDYYALPFTLQEGKFIYPDYFLPIIPCAILESTCLPAHGWKLQKWARDVFDVINATKDMIKLAQVGAFKILTAGSLRPCVYGPAQRFTGSFTEINGIKYSVGRYLLTGNILYIQELPLGVWNVPFMTNSKSPFKNRDPEIVVKANDHSATKVDIRIVLAPTALAKMAELNTKGDFDDITEYFKLRKPMRDCINLMGANDKVMSFACYESVFHIWFTYRKDLYADRVRRDLEVAKVKLYKFTNMIKFIDEFNTFNLSGMTPTEMHNLLAVKKYEVCDVSMLSPKWVATSDILQKARTGAANYNYLLSMSSLKMTPASRAKYVVKVEQIKATIAELNVELSKIAPGCDQWLAELNDLALVIKKGLETSWKFEEHGKYRL